MQKEIESIEKEIENNEKLMEYLHHLFNNKIFFFKIISLLVNARIDSFKTESTCITSFFIFLKDEYEDLQSFKNLYKRFVENSKEEKLAFIAIMLIWFSKFKLNQSINIEIIIENKSTEKYNVNKKIEKILKDTIKLSEMRNDNYHNNLVFHKTNDILRDLNNLSKDKFRFDLFSLIDNFLKYKKQ